MGTDNITSPDGAAPDEATPDDTRLVRALSGGLLVLAGLALAATLVGLGWLLS